MMVLRLIIMSLSGKMESRNRAGSGGIIEKQWSCSARKTRGEQSRCPGERLLSASDM